MRLVLSFSILCGAGLMIGCAPDEVIPTEDITTAGVRFIHAVPDTGALDFRPVDIVENTAFYGVSFRSNAQVFYKNARSGERNFKIFLTPDRNKSAAEQQQMASTVVQDINVTLEPGRLYTFILWGYARTGSTPAMQLTVLEDNPSDPGSQVALRIVNAGVGLGDIDGYQYARGPDTGTSCPGGAPPPAAPTWASVPEMAASSYITVDPGLKCYRVTLAGDVTELFTDALALAGAPPNLVTGHQAIPGTTQAGSAVTGFVLPPSVVGSQAPQTLTAPTILFFWDRRPPNQPGF
ncbi:MAG TPA: DUF4397 domain-containing protein [Gemmatimonadales bacterium]|nr:DUF4397 domain-containing protein [Gemmatimonadales bacterium]